MNVADSSQTILMVEDDPAVANALEDIFMDAGYPVDWIKDGKSALHALAETHYGLLLTDILLPHLSGLALVELVRAQPEWQELPIAFMSGFYKERNQRTLLEKYHIHYFFEKPLDFDKLLAMCREVLGVPRGNDTAKKAAAQKQTVTRHLMPALPQELMDSDSATELRQVEREARLQFRASPFVMQGSVRLHPVPALLGQLWHQGAHGALLLRREGMKKIYYLRFGSPYAIKSNLVSECLGHVLVQERLITRAQCEESIRLMQGTKVRQGHILVETMEALSADNLRIGLQKQLETKLFSTFRWDSGEYRFNPSAPLEETHAPLPWSSPALIVEGVRRLDETFMRLRLLPVLDTPLRLRPQAPLPTLGLTERELQALSQAELPQTSRALLENLDLAPGDTLRVIYALVALEMLVPSGSAA